MRLLGISFSVHFPESVAVKKFISQLSAKLNRFSDKTKRQLVIVFVLLAVSLSAFILLQGFSRTHSARLQIPDWEPPLIYYDSILYHKLTELDYETTD